jgi:hypothetical protein
MKRAYHGTKQPPDQMTPGQEQPEVPSKLDHSPARPHLPLLQARQQYLLELIREMLQPASQDELHTTDGKAEFRGPVNHMLVNGLPSIWGR